MSRRHSKNSARRIGIVAFRAKRRPLWAVHNQASGFAGGLWPEGWGPPFSVSESQVSINTQILCCIQGMGILRASIHTRARGSCINNSSPPA